MKASDALARYFEAHGMTLCFEVAGGMITHLLDSLSSRPGMRIVSMHHEQAAAFAAEGVSRISQGRQLAVAMATSGPGATNLVTGIASCWFDSIPCLFLTGQVNESEQKGELKVRQQGFQEMDVVSMVGSFTKMAASVQNGGELLPRLHQAIESARSGRKGPVLLDVSFNAQVEEVGTAEAEAWIHRPWAEAPPPMMDVERSAAAREMIRSSRRPLICLGGGAAWSSRLSAALDTFNRKRVPYVATLMGCQWMAASPMYLGMMGTYGRRAANWAVQNCDLLIAVGSRLDIRQTGADARDFARNAKIIQVDIDPGQLGNRVAADLSLNASADEFLTMLIDELGRRGEAYSAWPAAMEGAKAALEVDEYPDEELSPVDIFREVNAAARGRPTAFVMDVGNHQMWAAALLDLGSGQSAHFSGGHGAMGFGLPASIGISSAWREGRVLNITGDGSLQMNIQELDTLRRLGPDVTVLVLDNASLGMVRNFQDMYFGGRNQSTVIGYSRPDFAKVAAAYGLRATAVSSAEGLRRALRAEMEGNGPGLVHVLMEGGAECRPRLAFGARLDEQLPRGVAEWQSASE
jgi:acetolactate synthase-1/2/3 large subunit